MEMKEIADYEISKYVPQIIEIEMNEQFEKIMSEKIEVRTKDIMEKCLNDIIGAMEYDVNTTVEMSFSDASDVFRSKSFQKYISTKIVDVIRKNMNDLNFK